MKIKRNEMIMMVAQQYKETRMRNVYISTNDACQRRKTEEEEEKLCC